jgi:hypothetical protein
MDSDCTGGQVCDFRGVCVDPIPGGCSNDAECEAGQLCIEGACRAPADTCQFEYECGPGRACVNGGCVNICGSNADCGSGTVCEGGFCVPNPGECTSSAQCESGERCVDGRCLQDCRTTGCENANDYCADDGFCRPRWQRDPFCSNDSDCAAGSRCIDGACRTPCTSGTATECMMTDVSLTVCSAMLCYTTAESNPECESAADCGAGERCVNAICR